MKNWKVFHWKFEHSLSLSLNLNRRDWTGGSGQSKPNTFNFNFEFHEAIGHRTVWGMNYFIRSVHMHFQFIEIIVINIFCTQILKKFFAMQSLLQSEIGIHRLSLYFRRRIEKKTVIDFYYSYLDSTVALKEILFCVFGHMSI